MGRYYNDCLIHSYDYSDFPEYEYEEQTDGYEVLSRYWDDVIEHAGIKGMKWGQRRYQNEDGSYTEAGMIRRYGHGHLSGPRHFGSSRSSYRTGARSSSPSAKRKGLSTGAKVALAAAGLAAAGAAGYGIYRRGRRANDAQSEGWSQAKLAEYQRKNKESKDEFEKAYSAWDKSRKTHVSDGYRYTDQGDLNLKRAMEDAKQRNAVDGGRLIDYQSRDPEAAARARREHKVGAAIKDFEAGINDIRRNGLIDKRKPTKDSLQKNFSDAFNTERKGPDLNALKDNVKNKVNSLKKSTSDKVTKDSLQKNFSNAFNTERKGPDLNAIKENVTNKVNSLKKSNSDKVTKDSLQRNFSNAFDVPKKKEKESGKTIDASILTKEQEAEINKQIDRYNEAVRAFNNRNKTSNSAAQTPKSNLQMGPKIKEEVKKETSTPKQEPKKEATTKPTTSRRASDEEFEIFDRMMSDPNSNFSLDDYTQELLKRNQKTLNSIRR